MNRSGELLNLLELGRNPSNCSILSEAPAGENGSPIVVNVSVNEVMIYALGEDELLDISAWIKMEWKDRRLAWKPSEWDNVTNLMVSPKTLWIPDLGLWNVKDIDYVDLSSRMDKIRRVFISNKGTIIFTVKISPKIPCPMDTSLYPFDHQDCFLELGPFQSDSSKFTVQVPPGGVYYMEVGGGEWYPVEYRIVNRNNTFDDSNMPSVRVYLTVKRKALYHILLIIVPFLMLSLMGVVLFVATSVNDRVNVAVAVLLAMTLFVMMIAQTAPKSMQNVPMMGVFLLSQMGLLILFTGLSTLMVPEKVDEELGKEATSSNASQKHRNSIFAEDEAKEVAELKIGWRKRYCNAVNIKNYLTMLCYIIVTLLNTFICLKLIPSYSPAKTKDT